MSGSPSTVEFRKALLSWFARDGKSYPWRETTDPWHILVSEIMLQQTTIPTVLGRYSAWLQQFPTPRALADADEQTALLSWEGLGYYRRVRSLQNIAKAVVERHGGEFPRNAPELMALPGIGEYTCGALLSFAFNIAAPIVDTNVSRVIARLDHYTGSIDSSEGKKYMWERAAELVDPVDPRSFNSAIMELGQTYCKSKTADCLLCPVRSCCTTTDPLSLPVKTPRASTEELIHHDILHINGGRILLARQTQGRHVGMYRLPERKEHEITGNRLLLKQKYSITRYKVTRYVYLEPGPVEPRPNETLVAVEETASLPMASPDRKCLSSRQVMQAIRNAKSS